MITLTNGVQVPENAVQLRTTASMDGYYVTQPLQLVQYDETLPVAAVQLTYQSQPYIPPTGAELNVRMNKPDGKGVYNPCLGVDSSGIVYFVFTQQMTAAAGDGKLTIEVTDSGVKNSATITVNVAENPVQEGSIESTDEFLTLQEILAEAEKWGQIVQANAANIQEVIDNLPAIEAAPEAAQQAAASAAAAQQAAQEALGFRTFFSAVTPDANGNLDPSRPMTVGPAASVEIESAGDRIQSVTANGFTQQAGTGDPSPTNVRAITNGGIRYGVIVYDGSSDESYTVNNKAFILSPKPDGISAITDTNSKTNLLCDKLQPRSARETWSGNQGVSQASTTNSSVQICVSGITTTSELREWLKQNPITVRYPLETGSLYAPIILEGGEYRATCLPLTAPLCEGDSVVSWVKSGCDKAITFDGSEDENWETYQNCFVIWNVFANSVPIDTSGKNENIYTNILHQQSPDSSGQHAVGTFYAVNTPASGNFLVVNLNGGTDISAFRAALAAHPLTVWYRSANYTEAADIPVSLETHRNAVLVLDGTENAVLGSIGHIVIAMPAGAPKPKNGAPSTNICSVAKFEYNVKGAGVYMDEANNQIIFGAAYVQLAGWSSADDCKAYLADQYDAGTPVTIVYQLATPITYAHPAVELEAATGDQLTYTVTGQSGGTVSVALKPFQDGGNAKTADSATTAQNATQFDGHAWSEVPGQAPVQSVNGKTGAVTLTAADVGAATTAQGQKADSALIFMGFLPNGTAVNSIQNGIWDGDASHRPNPAPDGLNEDLTIVKAGRYLQATDVFGNAKRWNFYSSVWSDPV